MDFGEDRGSRVRTVLHASRGTLAVIAVMATAVALLWIWLAFAAMVNGGFTFWLITPVSLALAAAGGWVAWWSFRRRLNIEPALIIDEVGLFDNVSLSHAGRMKWNQIERIWMVGPRWMPFLCILPTELKPYLDSQTESRGLIMRLLQTAFGAPVVFPMSVLDIASDEAWHKISDAAGSWRSFPATPVAAG